MPADCTQFNKFVQVETKELVSRADREEQPDSTILKTAGVHATVTIKVFVDGTGRVVCDSLVGDANPFLTKLSLRAAKAWHFRPLLSEGQPVGMQGNLIFQIER